MKVGRVTSALVFLLALGVADAWACVGKTLQVGVVARGEERLLTRMLSILVNERTGTSIKIREFADFRECFNALQKSDIDLIIACTGQAYAEVTGNGRIESSDAVMSEVRKLFNEKYNLVWLEPWGLLDGGQFVRDASGRPVPTQAAPLVRKDTLKEFPALARLINKMSGRLDGSKVAGLMKKQGDMDRTARDYLRTEKLI